MKTIVTKEEPARGSPDILSASAAARAPVTGVKLAMDGPPGQVGPLPKMKISRFSPTLLSRAPLGPRLGPLKPKMGHLRLKIDHCRPDMRPLKHASRLFLSNFDSERLHYLKVRIKNVPPGSERRGDFTLSPTGGATAICCLLAGCSAF